MVVAKAAAEAVNAELVRTVHMDSTYRRAVFMILRSLAIFNHAIECTADGDGVMPSRDALRDHG
jgi:hypothetical protein